MAAHPKRKGPGDETGFAHEGSGPRLTKYRRRDDDVQYESSSNASAIRRAAGAYANIKKDRGISSFRHRSRVGAIHVCRHHDELSAQRDQTDQLFRPGELEYEQQFGLVVGRRGPSAGNLPDQRDRPVGHAWRRADGWWKLFLHRPGLRSSDGIHRQQSSVDSRRHSVTVQYYVAAFHRHGRRQLQPEYYGFRRFARLHL